MRWILSSDTLERIGDHSLLAEVENYSAKASEFTNQEAEDDISRFLIAISRRLARGLLLLVDNADRLFETIETREQWRLRELLSSSPARHSQA